MTALNQYPIPLLKSIIKLFQLLTLSILFYFRPKHKDATIFVIHLNTVMLVFCA